MKHLTLATLLAFTPAMLDAQSAGLREGALHAPHHGRDMDFALWYPVAENSPTRDFGGNPVFQPVGIALGADPLPGRHPLVLMSHGLGGQYRALGWLAAGLAQSGAVVIAVNHPNSTVGDFDMQAGLAHWTRAQDLSLALDHLLDDPQLAALIDPDRVAALGFSYGGWTALTLGGVRGNLAGYAAHCADAPTRHCGDIVQAGADLGALDAALWDGDYADRRIGKVVAIDPGLTYGLTPEDVAQLVSPTLLIQLGEGADRLDATDISALGSNLTGLLPQARRVEITPAAHFSVLPLCTEIGALILAEENDDPVCTDPEGADRSAIHARVLENVKLHLDLD